VDLKFSGDYVMTQNKKGKFLFGKSSEDEKHFIVWGEGDTPEEARESGLENIKQDDPVKVLLG
jgi:hypothetical protein